MRLQNQEETTMALLHLFPETLLLSPLLLSLTFVTFIYLLKHKTTHKKLNLPPSPPKLPIIGNLHQIGKLPHLSFRAIADKYGPIVLLHLGHSPTLIITSPSLAREAMKTHDIVFANRPKIIAAKWVFYGWRDISFSPYGEYWRQLRKLCVLELLNSQRVQSFQFIREEEIALMIKTIRSSCINGSSVNISEMLTSLSISIISRATFSQKLERRGDFGEIVKKSSELFLAFSIGDFYPSLGWMDTLTGLEARLKETFKALDGFMDQMIDEHRVLDVATANMSNKKDMVDVIFDLRRNGMLDINLDEDTVKAILWDMLAAGTDTTSSTILWVFSELIRNPTVMKKAQEEVRRVVGNKEKVEQDDITKMEYLQCVIKETLRLHPPVPLLLPRESSTAVKLGGYDIPPKTRMFINVWAIQRDPKLWERPEEFLPERFKDSPIDFKGQDFEYTPFGSGRRSCPGIIFGITVAELTVANLLCWFNWEMPDGGRAEDLDMSEASGISVSKKLHLHLVPKLCSNKAPCSIQE